MGFVQPRLAQPGDTRAGTYRLLVVFFTILLVLTILPRAFYPLPGFSVYDFFYEREGWGTPVLGIAGLLLLPAIAYAIGRGRFVASTIAYVVLQGTMRRFLLTDCGLPQFLVFWDNVPVVVLLMYEVLRGEGLKFSRVGWWVLITLLFSAMFSILTVMVNDAPLENALLGFWRGIAEGPVFLAALLFARLPRREITRLFFTLLGVLLAAHLAATAAAMISARDFQPQDYVFGVFGTGASNYISLAAGMVLLFLFEFATRRGRVNPPDDYLPTGGQKAVLIAGWLFLLIWGGSRFALIAIVGLVLLLLVYRNIQPIWHGFLSKRYLWLVVLFFVVVFAVIALQIAYPDTFSAVFIAKDWENWMNDIFAIRETDVNRGLVAEYNLSLLERQPELWLWGAGPGMYRSTTGNSLRAPMTVAVVDYFGGRYVAPMYLTDGLIEYGLPGLGLILLIPILTLLGLPWLRRTGEREGHPMQASYLLIIILLLTSLTTFSTIEFRGVMLMIYLMAGVVLSRKA